MPENIKNPEKSTHAIVLLEPPVGVLVSMALCLDHGFAFLSKEAKTSRLQEMRKLYDEAVGQGYYQPDRCEFYQEVLAMTVAPGIAAILNDTMARINPEHE
jgi:hypothetical protein